MRSRYLAKSVAEDNIVVDVVWNDLQAKSIFLIPRLQNQRKQLLRVLFDLCNNIHSTTHPHDFSTILCFNDNLQNAVADVYEAPPHLDS